MLSHALTILLGPLIAGDFSFTWLAGTTASIAKVLFVGSLVAVSLLAGRRRVAA